MRYHPVCLGGFHLGPSTAVMTQSSSYRLVADEQLVTPELSGGLSLVFRDCGEATGGGLPPSIQGGPSVTCATSLPARTAS